MKKNLCLYKRQYKDILIEVKIIGDRISLYINDIERDYFRIFSVSKEHVLKCQLNNETNITIIYKSVFLRDTITVFVNETQIDYVNKVKTIK